MTTNSAADKSVSAGSLSRMTNLDRLRLLAIIDIIWFHVDGTGHAFVGLGLPVFLIVLVSNLSTREAPQPWPDYLARVVRRLFVPWAVWSLVYLAIRLALKGRLLPPGMKEWQALLVGGAPHLWFLVWAMLVALLVRPIHEAIVRIGTSRPASAVWLGVAGLALSFIPPIAGLPAPFAQWWFAIPALPLGIALGRLVRGNPMHNELAAAGLFTIAVVMVCASAAFAGELQIRWSIAVAAVFFVVCAPGRRDRVTAVATELRYGLYLSHALFLYALLELLEQLQMASPPVWLTTAIVTAGGFGLTAVLKRTPLHWMV